MEDLFGDDAWGEEVRRSLPTNKISLKTSFRYTNMLMIIAFLLFFHTIHSQTGPSLMTKTMERLERNPGSVL